MLRIDKTRRAMKRLDVEASHLLFPAPAFVRGDVVLVAHEIRDGRLSPEREIDAKELARTQAGKRQRRFAQRLARDRAGVDPGAADIAQFFHERDALAEDPRGIRSARCRPARRR